MPRYATDFNANFAPVVVLSLAVDLMTMLLLKCSWHATLRGCHVSCSHCWHLTLERERETLPFHGGHRDGIDSRVLLATRISRRSRPPSLKQHATTSFVGKDRPCRLQVECPIQHSRALLWNRETRQLGRPPELSSPLSFSPHLPRTTTPPCHCHVVTWHCAGVPEPAAAALHNVAGPLW